jgi:hypothetical protein
MFDGVEFAELCADLKDFFLLLHFIFIFIFILFSTRE